MFDYARKYLMLILIVIITVIVTIILSIVVSGSRTTGVGNGQLIGIFLGNLIFSLIQRGSLMSKILSWFLSSVIIAICIYVVLNYLPIDNTVLLMITAYLLPLILAWEITRRTIPLLFKKAQ